MRDNWAVGCSQAYTVGVWVGNASGESMWDVSGTTGAAPIWAEVMGFLHQRQPSRAPAAPPGLVQTRVQFEGAAALQLEAPRQEWFLAGTQQQRFAMLAGIASDRAARITAPANGTVLALDPDIPPSHQRLRFTAEGAGLRWAMDGKVFAHGNSAQWLPWPGRHVVQLRDVQGTVQDEIRLEVRGAGVRAR
jgi:penicillin-binding protein 1C